MHDLKARLANKVQLTTDGYKPYFAAVEDAFGATVDDAMLQKIYRKVKDTPRVPGLGAPLTHLIPRRCQNGY